MLSVPTVLSFNITNGVLKHNLLQEVYRFCVRDVWLLQIEEGESVILVH